jgi:hypothetical protein
MGRQALKYSFFLIAIYLGVAYASGSGRLLKEGSAGATSVIRAFQGRK